MQDQLGARAITGRAVARREAGRPARLRHGGRCRCEGADPGEQLGEESARELATLREALATADATTPPGALPAFGRLVTEYGLRSFQTMHDWALWAPNQIDQSSADVSKSNPADKPHE